MLHAIPHLVCRLLPALALTGLSFGAQAYDFKTLDPLGGQFTTIAAINGSGRAVGSTVFADSSVESFLYDARTGVSTPLPAGPGGLAFFAAGINDAGTIVGALGDFSARQGAILDKKGRFTTFTIPGFAATEPRAIGPTGLVSGYAVLSAGNWSGFLYDPATGATSFFLRGSSQVIPQGINARGQVVGSVALPPGGAYPGSPPGNYGFVRDPNGSITLFRVNGETTRARGISDAGTVTGFVGAPAPRGFTVAAPSGGGYRDIAVAADRLFSAPGAEQTFPQAIDNRGRIVGSWLGADGVQRGFLAMPSR